MTADRHMWLAILCASILAVSATRAGAQCSARDVMRSHPNFAPALSAADPPIMIGSVADIPIWRTIKIGTSVNKYDLLRRLDAADCSVGTSAEALFLQRGFTVSSESTNLDLAVVYPAQLGLRTDTATLAEIYARALDVGLALPGPEVGPQLRLQYFDQPIGEFLNIAMAPITPAGEQYDIFVVGNGGAGLFLIGESVRTDTEFDRSSRFVFVRPVAVAAISR